MGNTCAIILKLRNALEEMLFIEFVLSLSFATHFASQLEIIYKGLPPRNIYVELF